MTDEKDKGVCPFGQSPAARTRSFAEHEAPSIDFRGQFKHDTIHMFDTDGEGQLYYGPAVISTKASVAYGNHSNN